MAQPDDYEWFRASPYDFRCYPYGVAREGAPHLRVLGVRSKLAPIADVIIWGAYWVERFPPAYRIERDGVNIWGTAQGAIEAATWWHRHVVESYDPHHDWQLQQQGYTTVEVLNDAKPKAT